jgi:diguanylate cyclase (GGDEF)-like protein
MLMNDLSIKSRLRLIKVIAIIAMLCNIVLVHQSLMSASAYDDEYHVVQSTIILMQEESDLVEALRGDFYAVLLTSVLHTASHAEAWQRDMVKLRAVLNSIDTEPLPPGMRSGITSNVDDINKLAGDLSEIGSAPPDRADGAKLLMQTVDDKIAAIHAKSAETVAMLNNDAAELGVRLKKADSRAFLLVIATGITTVLATVLAIGLISRSIRRSLSHATEVAGDIAAGRLDSRCTSTGATEIGQLGACLNAMAKNMQTTLENMRVDADERTFSNQLLGAFEISDSEAAIFSVVSRAMAVVTADLPMEMLLADSSRAHLERAAEHPDNGAPGCGVTSPNECMAVRRGRMLSFADSDALDACPKLRGRACGAVSAICSPINFMGNAMGVLHAAGPPERRLTPQQQNKFQALGLHAGHRIGMVRAFARSQLQAATDGMTGLANRRSMEAHLHRLAAKGRDFALVMADLDNFKKLNDTYGHQAGDRALKLFAEVLRNNLREEDLASRWGGEEFVVVLLGTAEHTALAWTDRVRQRLAGECAPSSTPAFTCSFGIAHSSLSADPKELTEIADEALYQSKEDGRDRATVGTIEAAASRHDTESNEIIKYPMSAADQ